MGSLMAVGFLAWGANWLPAPAMAGGNEANEPVLVLRTNDAGSSAPVVLAAFVADDERERPGRSPEAEAGPRRSPEAEAGPRRSPEGEAGPRRSSEAEAGPRRSPEADARRDLGDFRPATEREAALYRMILQLRSEVAQLRQAMGSGDGEERRIGDRQPAGGQSLSAAQTADWQRTKAGGVFKAYDKNGDLVVTLDEWLGMTNGNINEDRRRLQTTRFREAEPSGDDRFTPEEFLYWYTKGRFESAAEGSSRDAGEGARRGPRDGEGERPGPRDGERERSGPRDRDGDARR
jgi:hypothetical protein